MHANSSLRKPIKYSYRILATIFLFFGSLLIIQAQSIVSGKISDAETGELLPGVNVFIKGKQIGTVSDMNGFYSLKVPAATDILQFSYIGYLTQTAVVEKREKVDIQLKQDKLELEEVMVVGYGTVKKSDLTGAVSSVNSKDFGDRQVNSIAGLLQGKTTGLDVNNDKIRIRGVSTFGNSDPLIVIDGFPGGNLSTINPNDIEHIEVLKDASSTAIYGARGANGVVLVTTKDGRAGEPQARVNVFTGFGVTPKKLDVLNANQYVDYATDALTNSGTEISAKLQTDAVRNDVTNWQNEVFRTANSTELNFDYSGGSEKVTYFFSLGYRLNQKITTGSGNSELYMRIKNNIKLTKWLRTGLNLAFSYNSVNGSEPETMSDLVNMLPYMPVTDSTNSWGYSNVNTSQDLSSVRNPVTSIKMFYIQNNTFNTQSNLWAEIKFIPSLIYRIQAGVNGSFYDSYWWRSYHMNDGNNTFPNRLSEFNSTQMVPVIEQYLTYTKDFQQLNLSAMAGTTWQNNSYYKGYGIFGEWTGDAPVKDPLKANSNGITSYNLLYDAYLSYFGRVNCQLNDKYLLSLNFRMDGSPRIPEQNRMVLLPSASLAWKMHEEEFIKNLGVFDQLKVRAGWGKTGNDATTRSFVYVPSVWNIGVYYPFGTGSDRVSGSTVKYASSPDLKWETTTSIGGGIDFAILRNSLSASIDYFHKNSEGVLFGVPLPASMGYGGNYGGEADVNAASTINSGFELLFGYRFNVGLFKYNIDCNYTYIQNEVTSLGQGQPYLDKTNNVSRTDVGNPIGYFYGFIADGIFETKKELDEANMAAKAQGHDYFQSAATTVGDVRFKDLNGDSRIDFDTDRTNIGDPIPNHLFGVNMGMEYKGFDFNMYWQGIAGCEIYNIHYALNRAGTEIRNQETYVLNRWRSESEPGNGIVPRAVLGDPAQNNRPSTLMVSNGDYLKLRQLSFGYNFPRHTLEKLNVEKFRLYVSASNILTISNYEGYDPEVSGDQKNKQSGNLDRGMDYYRIPVPKSVVFGFQLEF